MSQQPPTEQPRKRDQPKKDWNAFDLELISCAKHQWVVDFYFLTDIRIDSEGDEGDGVYSLTGTVQVVDIYFLKISIPTDEGKQREVWIAKAALAAIETHKIRNSG